WDSELLVQYHGTVPVVSIETAPEQRLLQFRRRKLALQNSDMGKRRHIHILGYPALVEIVSRAGAQQLPTIECAPARSQVACKIKAEVDDGLYTPQLDCVVPTPGGQAAAIRTKCHAGDRVLMACEGGPHLPGGYIPQLDRVVPTPGGQAAAIRTKCHAPDRALMAREGGPLLPGGYIPQLDRVVPTP